MKRTKLPPDDPQYPITFPIAFFVNEEGDPDIGYESRLPRSLIDLYKPQSWPLLIALAAYAWFIIKHRCDPREVDDLYKKRIHGWRDIRRNMKEE